MSVYSLSSNAYDHMNGRFKPRRPIVRKAATISSADSDETSDTTRGSPALATSSRGMSAPIGNGNEARDNISYVQGGSTETPVPTQPASAAVSAEPAPNDSRIIADDPQFSEFVGNLNRLFSPFGADDGEGDADLGATAPQNILPVHAPHSPNVFTVPEVNAAYEVAMDADDLSVSLD
jgi:hypothetical protein